MKRKNSLEISIADARWRKIPHLAARLEKAAHATFTHLPKELRFPATAVILLTHDKAMRRLNHDFRGIGRPTNVLSFPQFELPGLAKKGKTGSSVYLGDVAVGYQYVVGEAKKYNKILINHLTHLLIHGLLHLLGYDHISEKKATRMERLETKIMSALGLPDPYVTGQPMESKRAKGTGTKRRAALKPKQ